MTYRNSKNKWLIGIHRQSGKKQGRMPKQSWSLSALYAVKNWGGRIGLSTISFLQGRAHPTMTLATYNRYVDNVTGVSRTGLSSEQPGALLVGDQVLYWAEDLHPKRNRKEKKIKFKNK